MSDIECTVEQNWFIKDEEEWRSRRRGQLKAETRVVDKACMYDRY